MMMFFPESFMRYRSPMNACRDHDRPPSELARPPAPAAGAGLPPPVRRTGVIGWMRAHLFRGPVDAAVTVLLAGLAAYLAWMFYDWAIASAVWEADNRRECIAKSPHGACWAGVIAWGNRFLYGRYPDEEIWRINLALVILLAWMAPLWMDRVRGRIAIAGAIVLLYPFWAVSLFLGGERGLFAEIMTAAAITGFALSGVQVICCLLTGEGAGRLFGQLLGPVEFSRGRGIALRAALLGCGLAGIVWLNRDAELPYVGTYKWGGLFLTLVVSGIGIASALPAGILLALGRRSRMPVIKALSVVYIELVRSVPLVTLMFMATTMFPLLTPAGVDINKLALAIISVCMFAAAYMAETVRGGIQAVPLGQLEAAQALGMRYWRAMGLVILPQALRSMIPNIVGSFIDLFKGTAVISIFGFYDLTNMLGAISQAPRWIMLFYEPIFVGGAIYFIGCFAMSRYSLYLERKLGVGSRR
jgi:general L-amino acid transport system permease protein